MNEDFFHLPVYSVTQQQKQKAILSELNRLNRYHFQNCSKYKNLIEGVGFGVNATDYASQPFIHARLFKLQSLMSIEPSSVFKTLMSSGTTSQQVSKIYLDAHTAGVQSKVLAKIMQQFIGKQRLPMLMIEKRNLIKDKQAFSARGAGVNGMSFLGRDHTYILNDDMSINWQQFNSFIEKYRDQTVLIFGFTFIVWEYFVKPLIENMANNKYSTSLFNNSYLFHSGGWKKLLHQAVSNETFSTTCKEVLGKNSHIHNFYGMVEQTGTIYVECEQGFLHTPVYSDIIIRNPQTLEMETFNKSGLIQLLSVLPESYPGHSIVTEDIGTIYGQDDCPCGRKGRYFKVKGRIVQAEPRGCSDTFEA